VDCHDQGPERGDQLSFKAKLTRRATHHARNGL
jgi:hypothetical protein